MSLFTLTLSIKSLINRWVTVSLTIATLAFSTALLLGVERIRVEAKAAFADTISGIDTIVGARSGSVQLLLYSVFRIGNATNNISWESYQDISQHPSVAWTVPISLGDSHRGFRVMGTTTEYFQRYRFGRRRTLDFSDGKPFDDLFDAVLGADVARDLGYELGDPIVVAHGIGSAELAKHDDKPFRVVGILAKTGTPVDRTVHVSLEAITAIHVDWRSGARIPGQSVSADAVRKMDLTPETVTAVLIGLNSRLGLFTFQRFINEYREEPLLAILPGVALQELWGLLGTAESALSMISSFVLFTGLLGMVTMLLAGLNERRREMAILRSVGARPHTILGLFVAESLVITVAAAIAGLALVYGLLAGLQPVIDAHWGLFVPIRPPSDRDLTILILITASGVIAGLCPALVAYHRSLTDGMTIRT